jgi:hypothetical protein
MAAGAWTFYNIARKKLADGTFDLDTNTFRMSLYTSASNAATLTLSTRTSVTSEVTEANGYSSSGKPLASVTWATGASAKVYRFNCAAIVWTAAAGSISSSSVRGRASVFPLTGLTSAGLCCELGVQG